MAFKRLQMHDVNLAVSVIVLVVSGVMLFGDDSGDESAGVVGYDLSGVVLMGLLETRFDSDLMGDCSSMVWSSVKLLTLDLEADEWMDDGGVLFVVMSPELTLKIYSSRVSGCSRLWIGVDAIVSEEDVGKGLLSMSTEVVLEREALDEIDGCWVVVGKIRCSN